MLVDLQVSLTGKDGAAVDPQVLIEGAKKAGLDGLVVTAEPAQFPALDAYRLAAQAHDLRVFAAAHVPSNRGLLLCVVPDAASLAADWAPSTEGMFDAEGVIDAVEAAGGVTVALRPYDRGVTRPMGDHIFTLTGLAACETQSGRLPGATNDLALDAASNLELPCVGSSGASGTDGLGTAATLFRTPLTSEGDLVEALRAGDCWPVSIGTRAPVVPAEARGPREPRRDGASGGGEPRRDDRGGAGARGDAGGAAGDREGGRRRRRRGGRGRGGRPEGAPRADGAPRAEGQAPRAEGQAPRAEGQAPREESRAEARDTRGNREPRPEGDGRRRRGGRGRGRGGAGGGGGGGGGPRGAVPEDIGNRVRARDRQVVDENAGNRVHAERENHLDENLGNRLRPGEQNILAPRSRVVDVEDDGDNVGNR
jgi:hypothetical protein